MFYKLNVVLFLFEFKGAGSCVLNCIDGDLSITLVGWRGTASLRAYTDANDTVHMLRLLGADLSKYGKPILKKKKQKSPQVQS